MYSSEVFCIPPENTPDLKPSDPGYFKRDNGNYSLLDKNGFVRRGVHVKNQDVIIGKVIKTTTKTGIETYIDASTRISAGEEGVVDRVVLRTAPSGYRIVTVMISQLRKPKVGDKLASRHGQKGTIGAIIPQVDMPYTSEGIVPDIIINPHSQPSRMTLSYLFEQAFGKTCVINGVIGDCTPFTEESKRIGETIPDGLMKAGYSGTGKEILYNGYTGEPMGNAICIGVVFYQRLKHMVDDKCHSRTIGNRTGITRQPLEGRARDGGLRFGEMERDCGISQGAASILEERLFVVSDPFDIPVCKICGTITSTLTQCNMCNSDNVQRVKIPYASKLMFQLLQSMLFRVQIKSK